MDYVMREWRLTVCGSCWRTERAAWRSAAAGLGLFLCGDAFKCLTDQGSAVTG